MAQTSHPLSKNNFFHIQNSSSDFGFGRKSRYGQNQIFPEKWRTQCTPKAAVPRRGKRESKWQPITGSPLFPTHAGRNYFGAPAPTMHAKFMLSVSQSLGRLLP
jgi:hypothetical protein